MSEEIEYTPIYVVFDEGDSGFGDAYLDKDEAQADADSMLKSYPMMQVKETSIQLFPYSNFEEAWKYNGGEQTDGMTPKELAKHFYEAGLVSGKSK